MANVDLRGKVANAAGAAKASLSVELWEAPNWEVDQDTSGSAARTGVDTTDSNGEWNFDSQDPTKVWLVAVLDGDKRFLIDARNKIQVTAIDIINNLFVDTISEHTSGNGVVIDGVTLKDGGISFTGAFGSSDAIDFTLGDSDDTVMRWSTGDADNHAFVIGLGDSNQGLHITDKGAVATDWDISATTHPNVYIHSNTTPATDYLRLGDHDGTTAYVDLVGGTTLAFEIAGNTELTITSSGLNVPANSDILFTGTTGTNDIVLTNGLADALSITDGSADILIIDTNTSGNVATWTAAPTFSGLITANGGITFAAGDDIAFTGTTGTNDITLTDSLADALSITRAGTDMILFDSSTPRITFTPATTFTGTITGPSGTWDSGGMDIASGDSYAISGTDVLVAATLGSGVLTSSLTTVGALASGSIATGFGAIDNGVSNITTGGIIKLDVDGSAENAAGSLTLGTGNDAGIYFDGTDLVFITNGAGASGIIFDSEDNTLEIKGSGTLQATFDAGGLDLVTGDTYDINGTTVLSNDTLGTGILTSSLTTVGAMNSGSIATGFGVIDNGTSNITTGGILKIDVDGTDENAAGSLTLGAGNDAGVLFDGTNLVIITNGSGASGIIFDSEDDTFEFKGSGTLLATLNSSGLDLAASDNLSFGGVNILADSSGNLTLSNIDTLDATTEATIETQIDTLSNLTTTGALNAGSITSGFGTIDTGSSTITTTGVITGGGFTIGSAAILEAELEILDGATVTTTELNLLDALDRGSILYGNASSVTTVLGQGSADQVLTSDGTDIAWQDAAGGGPSQAVQGDIEAETNENTYLPPDLIKHVPGVAKAWGKIEQSGTHTFLSSYNMDSSITDAGTGLSAVSFTVDFSAQDLIVPTGARERGRIEFNSPAVGSIRVDSYNAGDTTEDSNQVYFSVHGDQ